MMKVNIQLFADGGSIVIGLEFDSDYLEDILKKLRTEFMRLEKETSRLEKKKIDIEAKIDFNREEYKNKVKAIQSETDLIIKQKYTNSQGGITDEGLAYRERQQLKLNALEEEYDLKVKQLQTSEKNINKELKENEKTRKSIEERATRINNIIQKDADKEEANADASKQHNLSLSGILKKVAKWSLAVIGIRSVYNGIRKAISMVSSQSEQVAGQIKIMSTAVANALTPLVQKIMDIIAKIMVYINTLFAKLTGRALFDFSKAFKDANKNAKGTAKSVSKMVAGFDEMNVLQDNSSAGGGGGISTNPFSALQDFDLGSTLSNLWQKMTDFFENTDWQGLGLKTYEKLKEVFTSIDWAGIAEAIFEGLGAVLGGLAGFIWGFFKKAIEDISIYFAEWIIWAEDNGGDWVQGLLIGILNGLAQIGIWIYEHVFKPFIDGFKKAFGINSPSKVMEEMGGYIVDGLKQGVSNIWEKVKSIFENLKNKIIEAFTTAWNKVKSGATSVVNWIKEKFEPIKQFFTNLISKITGAVSSGKTKVTETLTGVKNKFTETINKVIDGVNKLIRSLNRIKIDIPDWVPGIGGNKFGLSIPEIPRLARGGIVNNPGRGVMMGNYIAGENGAEAVLPLTDDTLQKLANMIPITINLTNTMNGRVISRELQRVQNENDFAYNR